MEDTGGVRTTAGKEEEGAGERERREGGGASEKVRATFFVEAQK